MENRKLNVSLKIIHEPLPPLHWDAAAGLGATPWQTIRHIVTPLCPPGTLCAYGLWKRNSRWLSGSLYRSLVTPEIVGKRSTFGALEN